MNIFKIYIFRIFLWYI